MDYLDFEFYYRGSQSILNFKEENIDDRIDGVNGVTLWSGHLQFDNEKIYFHKLWFWYIIGEIVEILGEKEVFIKLFLTCKTKIYKRYINELG